VLRALPEVRETLVTQDTPVKRALRVIKETPDIPARPVPLAPLENKETLVTRVCRELPGTEETQELRVQKERLVRVAPL
jgi:hypothetical protein